jgi:threonine dehydratase
VAPVSLDAIRAARERAKGVVQQTPLVPAFALDVPSGNELWLKAENLQRTGSFKLRGAFNAVGSLSNEQSKRGVITYSSGNHGQAVAYAAHLLRLKCVVVMPEGAVPFKVEATRKWGAEVQFAGHGSLDREQRAIELIEEYGYNVIPPFDDKRIIAGQGTAGLEILEALPNVDIVVVPVGGGGLISGIATAVKETDRDVCVVGVEPQGAADARDSFRSGSLVTWETIETVADGLRTSRIGQLTLATIREYVDDIVTVTEEDILLAVGDLAMKSKLVVEPSGAVATAAVLYNRLGSSEATIVSVLSGGNISQERLAECTHLASSRSGQVPALL